MRTRSLFAAFVLLAAASSSSRAADIEGTITIQHKLTPRKVTPAAALYDRGPAVRLMADHDDDPLAFERGHVVVYIEGEYPSAAITADMSQQNRRFTPDLVVVPAGSTVSFPNMDPIFHNVFSLSTVKSFDLGNYPKDHTRTVTFTRPGIVFVNCHLHANMAAVVFVTPNRWGVKVDESGHFVLPQVPPGTYTVVAWHKTAGFFRKTIHVAAGENSTVDFSIPLDEDGHLQASAKQP